jgi:hypothetical protein
MHALVSFALYLLNSFRHVRRLIDHFPPRFLSPTPLFCCFIDHKDCFLLSIYLSLHFINLYLEHQVLDTEALAVCARILESVARGSDAQVCCYASCLYMYVCMRMCAYLSVRFVHL